MTGLLSPRTWMDRLSKTSVNRFSKQSDVRRTGQWQNSPEDDELSPNMQTS